MTRSRTVFWATFLPLVWLFGATAAVAVTGEDSGELITAAHQLGVAHPPGYPLWLLLTKGFQLLCGGTSVSHASNVASAVTTAAACGVLALLALRVGLSALFAVVAGLAAGLVHEVWNHATITEVYPLALLCFTGGILSFLRWREQPTLGRFALLAFVLGTGVAHHPLLLLFGPVFFVAALWTDWRFVLRPKNLAFGLLALGAPFLVYGQAWYAAAHEPFLSWGLKPELASLAAHWNREVYGQGPAKTALSFAKFGVQLVALGRFLVANLTLPGLLLALAGLGLWLRSGGFTARFLAALTVTGTLVLLAVLPFDLEREELFAARVFFLPAYLLLVLAAVTALAALLDRLPELLRPRLAPALLLLPVVLAVGGYNAHDRSEYRWSDDYGRAILAGCPQQALLFPGGDTSTFPLLYLQAVEQVRPDVIVLDRSGTVERAEALKLLPEAERAKAANLSRDELLSALARHSGRPVVSLRPERQDEGLRSVPCGLGFVLLGAADKDGERTAKERQTKFVAELKFTNESAPTVSDYTADLIRSHLAQVRATEAFASGRPQDALRLVAVACAAARGIKETYNNVGSLLADHGEVEAALVRFQEALAVRPDYSIARRNLVAVLRGLGRLPEALAAAAAGLAADPQDTGLFEEGIAAAFALADGLAVARICAVRIAAVPADPAPHQKLGDWAADYQRSPMAARIHYEAALRLAPDDAALKQKLADLPADDARPDFPVPEAAQRPFSAADLTAGPRPLGPLERSFPQSQKFRREPTDITGGYVPGAEHLSHLRAQLTGTGWTDPAAALPRPAALGEDR